MTDVIRKTYFYQRLPSSASTSVHRARSIVKRQQSLWQTPSSKFAHDATRQASPRRTRSTSRPAACPSLVQASDPIIHHTFDAGEGVLIPAEILHHAARGCRAFVILQPFGCLPNHVVGRGIVEAA